MWVNIASLEGYSVLIRFGIGVVAGIIWVQHFHSFFLRFQFGRIQMASKPNPARIFTPTPDGIHSESSPHSPNRPRHDSDTSPQAPRYFVGVGSFKHARKNPLRQIRSPNWTSTRDRQFRYHFDTKPLAPRTSPQRPRIIRSRVGLDSVWRCDCYINAQTYTDDFHGDSQRLATIY